MTDQDEYSGLGYVRPELPYVALNPKEVATLRLLAMDLTRDQIAKILGHTPNSVKSRLAVMHKKIGVRSGSGLVAWGYEHGYVLLPKERDTDATMRRTIQRLENRVRELQTEVATVQASNIGLEAQLRAAHAQITAVPWNTSTRARV